MHHQRSPLAATTTAIIGHSSAGMNVRCSARGSTTHPASSRKCSATMTGKWPAPDSTPPRRRLAFACRVETTSSQTRSTQMTASNV